MFAKAIGLIALLAAVCSAQKVRVTISCLICRILWIEDQINCEPRKVHLNIKYYSQCEDLNYDLINLTLKSLKYDSLLALHIVVYSTMNEWIRYKIKQLVLARTVVL